MYIDCQRFVRVSHLLASLPCSNLIITLTNDDLIWVKGSLFCPYTSLELLYSSSLLHILFGLPFRD